MNSVTVRLQGAEKLRGILSTFRFGLKSRVREVVATYGLLIESRAKELAPVDTGRLRASIKLVLASDGLGGEVVTNLSYAPYVELGTRFQTAQPFLFPAAEQYRQPFLNALKAAGLNV